ncbi:MAG: hypothetical protein Q8R30_03780 [bacterium]|nr:hypothetical protein [bacterium]MDZ4285786.1 hypothetical protein [Candidatus Sungbacteria bacterium]
MNWTKTRPSDSIDAVILIPALREQKQIKGTLEYFEKITNAIHGIRIVVVTTEREHEHGRIEIATQQIVEEYIAKSSNRIQCINYPHKNFL